MARRPDTERVAELLATARPIPLTLSPAAALCLVAQLQLALRHPKNDSQSAELARDFIRVVARHLPDELQELIDAGYRE